MPNIVPCPSCQRQLALPDEAAGKLVRCPQCNNTFTAPAASSAAVQSAPVPAPPPIPRREEEEDDEAPLRRRRRFEDDDDDDYGSIARRRGVPHRGGVILTLAILAWLTPCGFILGPIAWAMGNTDLKEMAAGRMDREGEGITQAGRIIGMVVTILMVVGIAIWCLIFMAIMAGGGRFPQ